MKRKLKSSWLRILFSNLVSFSEYYLYAFLVVLLQDVGLPSYVAKFSKVSTGVGNIFSYIFMRF